MNQEFKRFRYRRINKEIRDMYAETNLSVSDFIMPIFIKEGENILEESKLMKDVYHVSIDKIVNYLIPFVSSGLKSILIFSIPSVKKVQLAYNENGIAQKAIRIIKERFPDLEIISDVCLCSYTKDGHCHIGDNDSTISILAKIALSHAKAGADIVAPSDMMDGRVQAIKKILISNGYNTPIMSYAAKFASNFYGPFREIADCTPTHGDRKNYQMDFRNSDEAIDEIKTDIEEGSKYIIIKPALSYLDIISKASRSISIPLIAYNVSGEYAMIHNAIKNNLLKEEAIYETLISIKRAGAKRIITYFFKWFIEDWRK